jgi:hypothetical protein
VDLRRSKVRLSRALGVALTPKAARVMERRPARPGQHGRGRLKDTDYRTRLLEKQLLRAQYNIGERQLRRAVKRVRNCCPIWRPGWTPWCCAPVSRRPSTRHARPSATVTSASTGRRSTSPPTGCAQVR